MPQGSATDGPLELRVVIRVEDLDAAVALYRDSLGLPELAVYPGEGGALAVLLGAGRATIELANDAHHRYVDAVEVGESVAPDVRLAFEVADVEAANQAAVAAGASSVAPPTRTPWESLNARLDVPGGTQITLFEEPDSDSAGDELP